MYVNLVNEFVEVILVTCAEIDEGLNCLVGICRDLLSLASLDSLDCVVDKYGEICNAVVDVRRLVDTNKGFIEDGEEIAEELECGRLKRSVTALF